MTFKQVNTVSTDILPILNNQTVDYMHIHDCYPCYILGIGCDSITQIDLPYAVYWKEIGILLDVDSKQLEEFEQTCPNDLNASQKLLTSIKLATVTPPQISRYHKILNGIDL